MQEVWKDIEEYEGIYQISNIGRVKSLDRYTGNRFIKGVLLTPSINSDGYLRVSFSKDKKVKEKKVHRLVAQAFIPNPDNKLEINHIDGNKKNNRIENLEWCTRLENMQHAYRTGLVKNKFGKYNNKSKAVIQYNKNMKEVEKYGSVREAERITGFSQSFISACCRGKYKMAYGYIWKYEIKST